MKGEMKMGGNDLKEKVGFYFSKVDLSGDWSSEDFVLKRYRGNGNQIPEDMEWTFHEKPEGNEVWNYIKRTMPLSKKEILIYVEDTAKSSHRDFSPDMLDASALLNVKPISLERVVVESVGEELTKRQVEELNTVYGLKLSEMVKDTYGVNLN